MSMIAKFTSAKFGHPVEPFKGSNADGADEFGGVGEYTEGLSGSSSAMGVSLSKREGRRVRPGGTKEVFSFDVIREGPRLGWLVGYVRGVRRFSSLNRDVPRRQGGRNR